MSFDELLESAAIEAKKRINTGFSRFEKMHSYLTDAENKNLVLTLVETMAVFNNNSSRIYMAMDDEHTCVFLCLNDLIGGKLTYFYNLLCERYEEEVGCEIYKMIISRALDIYYEEKALENPKPKKLSMFNRKKNKNR